jgi:MoaA/NifB/PqqE/SkfB family radical SAM enzyme
MTTTPKHPYDLNEGLIAWLDLSTYCNAGCPQCHRTNLDGLGKQDWLPLIQWSLDEFKRVYPIDSLQKHSRFEICGTWGDPGMNKDIFQIVEYILTNTTDTAVQINTNAGMRKPDWWKRLGEMGGERLEMWFDIDGISTEMHSLYRQKVDLDVVKENVKAYCSAGGRACSHVIVFKHNQDYLFEIQDLIRSLGVKGAILFELSNRFYSGPTHSFTNAEGVVQYLEQATVVNHPLINGQNPIRDHKWKEEKGLVGHELDNS